MYLRPSDIWFRTLPTDTSRKYTLPTEDSRMQRKVSITGECMFKGMYIIATAKNGVWIEGVRCLSIFNKGKIFDV
jgi:hypothetical protein